MVRDGIHPDDSRPAFDSDFARSLGGGEDFNQVFRIVATSGSLKHLHAFGHLIERVAGRPLFIGAIQDVTARRARRGGPEQCPFGASPPGREPPH